MAAAIVGDGPADGIRKDKPLHGSVDRHLLPTPKAPGAEVKATRDPALQYVCLVIPRNKAMDGMSYQEFTLFHYQGTPAGNGRNSPTVDERSSQFLFPITSPNAATSPLKACIKVLKKYIPNSDWSLRHQLSALRNEHVTTGFDAEGGTIYALRSPATNSTAPVST